MSFMDDPLFVIITDFSLHIKIQPIYTQQGTDKSHFSNLNTRNLSIDHQLIYRNVYMDLFSKHFWLKYVTQTLSAHSSYKKILKGISYIKGTISQYNFELSKLKSKFIIAKQRVFRNSSQYQHHWGAINRGTIIDLDGQRNVAEKNWKFFGFTKSHFRFCVNPSYTTLHYPTWSVLQVLRKIISYLNGNIKLPLSSG